ncbi:YceD family protein [Aquamicrobium zhengzhouense]|uniref:DUF177 domain-containing protein n=1 Tax=Aquamicrobium zhengzhouense TaxID=2781738 RepID=A0ABS0S934_9HYPH|nr:DUF177 domain-containing protein [Aquamicrobium zhengzhouense]MBI1619195.1 DUF177 domain-containing protein [Aquamicrobium zhengzhouense]
MYEDKVSPISSRVQVSRLPKNGLEIIVEADAEQREALADEHDLRSVETFKAVLNVTAWRKGGVKVAGRVKAVIVQDCVVTLEPVEQVVDEEVSGLFLPEGSKLAVPTRSIEGEILLDAEGEDSPELFSGDFVDVGQLAEEFFAMGIDPYPRRPDAQVGVTEEEDEESKGPLYEQLKALQKKS